MSAAAASNTSVPDTLADLYAQYRALKKLVPKTDDEARRRACEIIRLGNVIAEAKRQANVASAEQRVANNDDGVAAAKVIDAIAESMAPILRGLRQELKAQRAELAALKYVRKERHGGKFQGEWSPEKFYRPGDCVNVGGTMWKCPRGNVGMAPGITLAWELAHPGVRQ